MGKVIIKKGNFPPLTAEQEREIIAARNRPINYEDIPPLTEEQLARLQRANSNGEISYCQ